ncbi:MAG: DUF4256 domain-containing protein [Candidatus Peregrinibacteria bacterium]
MKNPDGSITEERLSERNKLTCEEQATRVVFERFKGKRPDDSEITDLAGSGEMKERVRGLFARIESNAPSDEATTTDTESTPDPKEKRELSPEEMERTLKSLLNRSKQKEYKNLCPTIDWTRAEEALRATPEALWTVHQAKEHEPVIYFADETGFKIGSNLCIESPQATRNCVGHKQAAEWMKKNHPREQFNGDAETQAEDMGWGLITIEEARRFIQNTPPYYEQGWRYYHTPDNIKEIGYPEGPGRALNGNRFGASLGVYQYSARNHLDLRGWGGSLRVNYVS